MAEINWHIERYRSDFKQEWNRLVSSARNATFIFRRDYMDYHADRFDDCSLVAYHGDTPLALLPANIADGHLYSHRGLTYGGWLLPDHKVDGADMVALFSVWLDWCRKQGISAIHYKPLPFIYATRPAQEDLYALWKFGAVQESVLLSSAIDMKANPGFDYLRRRYLKRVAGVRVEETDDLGSFWKVLEECLADRHQASPVHTLAEISRLKSLFPANIRLFQAVDAEGVQAGVLIYRTAGVDHCQYIATTARARQQRLLPYLFRHLIDHSRARYFDFGTSNEDSGRVLNASLLANKFGYGASGVAYPQYLLSL